MPDRIHAPVIKNPKEFLIKLPSCEHLKLKNGIPVYYVNGGSEEVVKIEWVFSSGSYYERKNGIASATCGLINSGTSKLSSFEISNRFEFYGAFISTACYNEYAVVTLETLSKYLMAVLPVVSEIFTDAQFPESEIAIYKQNSIQRLKVNLKKCDFVANREINAMLYGTAHPYGKKITIEDIHSITRDDLVSFYKDYFLNAECKIFAAGKLPLDFEGLLDKYFGSLNHQNKRKVELIERTPSLQRINRVENDPVGVQAAIRIARDFPNRKHPDFKGAMVLNALLGGYFGSRLMSNIREEKGYTYGIYSYLQNYIQYSSWVITTEAGVQVAEATVGEVFKELSRLRKKPAEEEEMQLVKNYLIGHQLAALDGPFNIIDRWKSLILNDLEESFFYETIEVIKSISAAQVQELANKYFVTEDFYQLVVV